MFQRAQNGTAKEEGKGVWWWDSLGMGIRDVWFGFGGAWIREGKKLRERGKTLQLLLTLCFYSAPYGMLSTQSDKTRNPILVF